MTNPDHTGETKVADDLVERLERYEIQFLAGDQHDQKLANEMAKLSKGDHATLAALRQKIKDLGEYPFDGLSHGAGRAVGKAFADKIDALVNKIFGEPHG